MRMITLSFAVHSLNLPLIISSLTALGIAIVLLSCIVGACIIATSFVFIFIYVICECLSWPIFEKLFSDILRRGIHRVRTATYRAIIVNYVQPLDMLEGFPESINGRLLLRQQALEKLLPPMAYGVDNHALKSSECPICLDDYVVGESCRVFPDCKHMFHLSCIDHWLKNHLTCPVCRKCI
ncbi:hypothetical protein ERO13_A01G064050v2 [Gossypium hirsutum]|uniref:RING-type domain-containing protein n=1 Tax=Gossypium tomentosum TaxID=34277 RepID=A0A5D2RMS0_GOSTO|nr:hypothetical protein ERO13_A01G064050v2 [Gossypium hirsutum]TYI42147.1 hypothetical protein ES332_A01G077200v1 [Gossypium tomentosum]